MSEVNGLADVIQLYNGTDAVSRKGMNDRFAAANEKFEAVDGKTKEIEDHVESHSQQIAAHVADTAVHITGAERTAWNGKATTATLPATLTAAGWVGEAAPFTQEVAVAGITGIMNPLTDIILSEETDTAIAELEAWGMVSSITTGDGKITARCLEDKPEVDLNLQMKAVQ